MYNTYIFMYVSIALLHYLHKTNTTKTYTI